jgi:hypothetical protein
MYCAYGHNPRTRGLPFSSQIPWSSPHARMPDALALLQLHGGFWKWVAGVKILFIRCGSVAGVVIETDSVAAKLFMKRIVAKQRSDSGLWSKRYNTQSRSPSNQAIVVDGDTWRILYKRNIQHVWAWDDKWHGYQIAEMAAVWKLL